MAANHHEQDDHHDQLDQGAPAKPAAQAPQRARTRRSRCHPRSMPSHPPTRFTMGANSTKGVAHGIGPLTAPPPPTNRHLLTSPESPRQATTSPNSFVHLRALGAFVRDQGHTEPNEACSATSAAPQLRARQGHTGNNEGRNEKRPTTGPGVSIGNRGGTQLSSSSSPSSSSSTSSTTGALASWTTAGAPMSSMIESGALSPVRRPSLMMRV